MHGRRVRRRRGGSFAIVAVERSGWAVDDDCRHEVTHLDASRQVTDLNAIRREVRLTAACGAQVVIIKMSDPWLSKALLKYDSSIRSVEVAQRIRALHSDAERLGILVLIAGPYEKAARLDGPVEEYRRQVAVQAAIKFGRAASE